MRESVGHIGLERGDSVTRKNLRARTARTVFDSAMARHGAGSLLSFVNARPRAYPPLARTDRDRVAPGRDVTAKLLGDPPPGRSAQEAMDGTRFAVTDKDILALYDAGAPLSEIARQLNLPSPAVAGVLRRYRSLKHRKHEPRH